MKRLNNHDLAICLYLLQGNILAVNTSADDLLAEDLRDYFYYLGNVLQNTPTKEKLFYVSESHTYFGASVPKKKIGKLKRLLRRYCLHWKQGKLESTKNEITPVQEFKNVLKYATENNFQLTDLHVPIENMHVVLDGYMYGNPVFKNIEITVDEGMRHFFERETDGTITGDDFEILYRELSVDCTVNMQDSADEFTSKPKVKTVQKESESRLNKKRRTNYSDNSQALLDIIHQRLRLNGAEIFVDEVVGTGGQYLFTNKDQLKSAVCRLNKEFRDISDSRGYVIRYDKTLECYAVTNSYRKIISS